MLLNTVNMLAVTAENAKWAALASMVCLAAALVMGLALWKAIAVIGEHPEAAVKVRKVLLLGLALIEGVAIYGFILGLLILFG